MYRVKTLNKIAPQGLERPRPLSGGGGRDGGGGHLGPLRQSVGLCLPGQPVGHRPGGRGRKQHSPGPLLGKRRRRLFHSRGQRQRGEGAGALRYADLFPGYHRRRALGEKSGGLRRGGGDGGGKGQVRLRGPGALPEGPGGHRLRGHRRFGGQRGPGPGNGRIRLRPLPLRGRGTTARPPCPRGPGCERAL